jgi:hypothetical protein
MLTKLMYGLGFVTAALLLLAMRLAWFVLPIVVVVYIVAVILKGVFG